MAAPIDYTFTSLGGGLGQADRIRHITTQVESNCCSLGRVVSNLNNQLTPEKWFNLCNFVSKATPTVVNSAQYQRFHDEEQAIDQHLVLPRKKFYLWDHHDPKQRKSISVVPQKRGDDIIGFKFMTDRYWWSSSRETARAQLVRFLRDILDDNITDHNIPQYVHEKTIKEHSKEFSTKFAICYVAGFLLLAAVALLNHTGPIIAAGVTGWAAVGAVLGAIVASSAAPYILAAVVIVAVVWWWCY